MRSRLARLLVVSTWCICLGFPAQAADVISSVPDLGDRFQKGNQAYLDGDYDTAVSEYHKVLEAGVNHPDLAFNLANAYYRSGRKGLAVLFFEKALQMDPVDGAAASNLEIVRKSLIDRVVMPKDGTVGEPLWHGFIRGLSFGWLSWMFFSFYLAAFGVLIVRRLMRNESMRRLLFWVNIPVITLALVFGGLFASRIYLQEKVHHGVVIPSTAALLEGPEQSAKVQMEVHEGLKVRLLNEVGDHTRVKLANGVEGFILSSQIGRI